jgi:phage tail sheath protein FI
MSSTTTSLKKDRKTPGVYVTEFPAFPPSIVGVATAVPIFIGYTETAMDPSSQKPAYLQAVPIGSMADYTAAFGYGYDTSYTVAQVNTDPTKLVAYDFQANFVDSTAKTVSAQFVVGATVAGAVVGDIAPQFNLYTAMQLFYANGGGSCFVVSVANYWGKTDVIPTPAAPAVSVDGTLLAAGLDVSQDTRGPTMLVIPDACMLGTPTDYSAYGTLAVKMLKQASLLQDRVAILDLPGALNPDNWTKPGLIATRSAFYDQIAAAQNSFSYGVAYAPAVETSILTTDDVTFNNLGGSADSIKTMNNLLNTQAVAAYADPDTLKSVQAHIAQAFLAGAGAEYAQPDTTLFPAPPTDPVALAQYTTTLDQYLVNAVPLFGQIEQILVSKLNAAPPSGILAGVWTANDASRGVWNAPANVSLASVIAPKVLLTDLDQADYNVPLNGEAIDILRALVNRGTVVWGARTLDGNSLDYRYIQVRRTLIYIEQSIKGALQQFVFAANDGGTWTTVTAAISNFLTNLWQSGGLMGDKASDAFTVQCGLGSTMTGLDILNGYMIVNVTVQMIHPAEFIELTFTQTMQGV